MPTIRRPLLLVSVVSALLFASLPAARAITLPKTRYVAPAGADTGACTAAACHTIAYAMGQAASGDTVSMAAGTYAERLTVTKSLTFTGAGSGSTFVDGGGTGRVFKLGAGLKVAMNSLTIQAGHITGTPGGNLDAIGAGIYSDAATLTLNGVVVRNNSLVAAPGADVAPNGAQVAGGEGGEALGAGIFASGGTVDLVLSRIQSNSAVGGHGGQGRTAVGCCTGTPGGIGGPASGGGIEMLSGSLTVDRTTLSGNTVLGGDGGVGGTDLWGVLDGGPGGVAGEGDGGSVSLDVGVVATFIASTVSDSTATGGAGGHSGCPTGDQGLTDWCYQMDFGAAGGDGAGGYGGGIYSNASLMFLRSSVAYNAAKGGAGGVSGWNEAVANGNGGLSSGGGIFSKTASSPIADLQLSNVTVAWNQAWTGAGGIDTDAMTTGNSIIAGNNKAGFSTTSYECQGSATSAGGNVWGDPGTACGLLDPTDSGGGNVVAGAFQNNGGPTKTLMPGPVAIGVADSSQCGDTDQRGFPVIDACDAGAVEVDGADLAVTQGGGPDPVAVGDLVTFRVDVTNNGPAPADRVTLQDTVSGGTVETVNPSAGSCGLVEGDAFTCTFGVMAKRDLVSVEIGVSAGGAGPVSNAASVTGASTIAGGDPESDTNNNNSYASVTAVVPADVSLAVADEGPVAAGAKLTYDLSLQNAGPATATGVVVTATLPPNTSFATASPGCVLNGSAGVVCTVGTVAPTTTIPLQVAVRSPLPGTFQLQAAASSTTLDPDSADLTASDTATVKAAAKTKYVEVADAGPLTPSLKVPQGNKVLWAFTGGAAPRSVSDTSGMSLYASSTVAQLGTFLFTFVAAGTYPYATQPVGSGKIVVAMMSAPASGTATSFTLTWATANAPAGYVYDVQIRRPGSAAWSTWRSGVPAAMDIFSTADAKYIGAGAYAFRSRLRKTTGGASGWSPVRSVNVG